MHAFHDLSNIHNELMCIVRDKKNILYGEPLFIKLHNNTWYDVNEIA